MLKDLAVLYKKSWDKQMTKRKEAGYRFIDVMKVLEQIQPDLFWANYYDYTRRFYEGYFGEFDSTSVDFSLLVDQSQELKLFDNWDELKKGDKLTWALNEGDPWLGMIYKFLLQVSAANIIKP